MPTAPLTAPIESAVTLSFTTIVLSWISAFFVGSSPTVKVNVAGVDSTPKVFMPDTLAT